jgi:hypothetical protein
VAASVKTSDLTPIVIYDNILLPVLRFILHSRNIVTKLNLSIHVAYIIRNAYMLHCEWCGSHIILKEPTSVLVFSKFAEIT